MLWYLGQQSRHKRVAAPVPCRDRRRGSAPCQSVEASLAIADLRFAAWFLWITPLLTALSSFFDAERSAKDAAVAALRSASKKLDKAVSKGVIHQNQAANRKSALAKLASTL